jgi:hypothetical protein
MRSAIHKSSIPSSLQSIPLMTITSHSAWKKKSDYSWKSAEKSALSYCCNLHFFLAKAEKVTYIHKYPYGGDTPQRATFTGSMHGENAYVIVRLMDEV